MVFPKLEKESPVASMHEAKETEDVAPTSPLKEAEFVDDLEEEWNGSGEDWNGTEEDDGFLTDEEYDILDASDQEWTEAKSKAPLKK
jgi:next-to-BRCA1 protein 1